MQIPSPVYNTVYSQSQCLVLIVVNPNLQYRNSQSIFDTFIRLQYLLYKRYRHCYAFESHFSRKIYYIENVTYFLSSTMLESINKKCQFLINLKNMLI